jgi:hypothetical protein
MCLIKQLSARGFGPEGPDCRTHLNVLFRYLELLKHCGRGIGWLRIDLGVAGVVLKPRIWGAPCKFRFQFFDLP